MKPDERITLRKQQFDDWMGAEIKLDPLTYVCYWLLYLGGANAEAGLPYPTGMEDHAQIKGDDRAQVEEQPPVV